MMAHFKSRKNSPIFIHALAVAGEEPNVETSPQSLDTYDDALKEHA